MRDTLPLMYESGDDTVTISVPVSFGCPAQVEEQAGDILPPIGGGGLIIGDDDFLGQPKECSE